MTRKKPAPPADPTPPRVWPPPNPAGSPIAPVRKVSDEEWTAMGYGTVLRLNREGGS